MKKMIKFFAPAAIAALACVSCNKEIEVSVVPAEGIQIAVVADMPQTKTELTGANTIGWSAGDKIDFVNSAAGEKVASEAAVISDGKATYTGTVTNTGTFYAYYPTSSRALINNHGEVKFEKDQYPTTADTFDPKADVMVSTTFDVGAAGSYSTDPASIQFKRLGAFLKVYFVDSTTGKKLGGQFASSVSVQSDGTGKAQLVGKMEVAPSGIVNFVGQYYTVIAHYGDGVFDVDADAAFLGVYPATLVNGSQLIVKAETEKYIISKTVTMPKDVALGGGDVLPIRITIEDENLENKVEIERVWGKYSTAENYWNSYFSGTASSDRNIAMDDEYIYLPETTGTPKMWRIPVDGVSAPSTVNVTGVYSHDDVAAVTHALSCARMVPNTSGSVNGGKDFLMACSLNIDDSGSYVYIYSYGSGTSNAPTVAKFSTWAGRRLGDKFSVWGSLQNGGLFFKDNNNAGSVGAFCVLKMAWSELPVGAEYFNPRRTNMVNEGGIGGYYPYPDNVNKGLYSKVDGSAGTFASFASSPLSTSPNESGSFTDAGGYYGSTAGFNYISFNGKKYIAYVKNASGGDGRFYILEGASSDSWEDILGAKRKVIYQATIHKDAEYFDGDYHADLATGTTKTSPNSALDCSVRVVGDEVYFAALKQGVGLSLFKMSLK